MRPPYVWLDRWWAQADMRAVGLWRDPVNRLLRLGPLPDMPTDTAESVNADAEVRRRPGGPTFT